jgi:hypothetical protein
VAGASEGIEAIVDGAVEAIGSNEAVVSVVPRNRFMPGNARNGPRPIGVVGANGAGAAVPGAAVVETEIAVDVDVMLSPVAVVNRAHSSAHLKGTEAATCASGVVANWKPSVQPRERDGDPRQKGLGRSTGVAAVVASGPFAGMSGWCLRSKPRLRPRSGNPPWSKSVRFGSDPP